MKRRFSKSQRHVTTHLIVVLLVIIFSLGFCSGVQWQRSQHGPAQQTTSVSNKNSLSMNQTLASTLSPLGFSGTAIVFRHGHPVATYCHGWANRQTHQRNTINTMYEIDSMQKSLTAGILMRQVLAKRVTLNDSIGKFYPTFKPDTKITVRRLLQMSSGLNTKGVVTPKYTSDRQLIQANLQQLIIAPAKFNQFQYTPVNYLLIAGICEQVAEQSYQTLFEQQYCQPLHLKHTQMAYAHKLNHEVARGYDDRNEQHSDGAGFDRAHAELGTGQVFMSATDFYQAERSLLTQPTFRELYQHTVPYSGGFYMHPRYYQTNGTGYGYFSTLLITPDSDNAVVIMSNTQNVNRSQTLQQATTLMEKLCLTD